MTLSIFSSIFISISGVNHARLESIKWIGVIFSQVNFHFVRDFFIIAFSLWPFRVAGKIISRLNSIPAYPGFNFVFIAFFFQLIHDNEIKEKAECY